MMEVMYLLIAFSLLIASGFLLAFMWAVRSGQYDDRYTPSVRMLMDDIRPGKRTARDGKSNRAADHHQSGSGPGGETPGNPNMQARGDTVSERETGGPGMATKRVANSGRTARKSIHLKNDQLNKTKHTE
ncbi:MAG: cbb3-type cytochrome oxidase assembly protein CcoS [Cyclonatronaceae bacterium]